MKPSKSSTEAVVIPEVNDPSLLRMLRPAQDTPEVRVYLATLLEWKAYIHHLEEGTPQNKQLDTLIKDAQTPAFRSATSQGSLEKASQYMISNAMLRTDSLIRFLAEAVRNIGKVRSVGVHSSRRCDDQGGAGMTT